MKIPKSFLFVLLLLFTHCAIGQNETPVEEKDGVRLKKVVPDTSIATGQGFSYYLHLQVPAGLDSINISDVLPAGVVFHSITIPASLGSPTVTTPAPNTNGTIRLHWVATTAILNGMATVTVSFPNGITCNGAFAANRIDAEWWRNRVYDKMSTRTVGTRAIATNPWRIEKKVLGLPNVGGACPFNSVDTVITYNIRVYKVNGDVGQLNMTGGVVRDTLPPGAFLVGTSSCVTQVGNVLIWNIDSLSALPNYNAVNCTFSVSYPAGTTSVINKATLTGDLGPRAAPCGSFSANSSVCVNIVPPSPGGVFNKTVSTTGQPGCGGRYVLSARNTGTAPATLTIRDTIPSYLTVGTITVSPAGALSFTYNPVTHVLTATTTGTIAINQTVSVTVNFTISNTTPLGIAITNCAYDTLTSTAGTITGRPCATFNTNVPPAKACVWKQVCNKRQSYAIGDTIRYRLRVQNTGGIALTGGVITDVLSGNLQYIGGISTDSSLFWNNPCTNAPGGDWGGVTSSVAGNTVTFNLPPIPAICQTAFYNGCGAYGSPLVPFYFIEFNVRVVDTAALGNTPNAFSFSATGIPAFNSNIDLVNITGILGLGATKEVSNDGNTWSSATTSSPGGTISYRLKSNINPGSVGLRHMSFVDLLPRNNNGSSDHFILTPCNNRGSAFDVTYLAPIGTSPAATGFNNAGTYASVNLFNPTPFAGTLFNGCGTSANTWNTGIAAGDRNLGYYFDYNGIGSGSPAVADFSAKVSGSAAENTSACNSFALIGFVKYLYNTSSVPTTNFVSGLPVESNTACVTVTNVVKPCIDKLDYKIECLGKNALGFQQYAIDISGVNVDPAGTNIALSSPEGSVSPNNFSVPLGSFVASTVFTDIAPANNPIHIFITLLNKDNKICRDTLEVKLPECREEKDCCTDFIHEFLEQSVSYDVDKDQVYLVGCVRAGPAKIQNFGYTIVSAERQIFCEGRAFEPERIYGDIVYGGLNMNMYPGITQTLDYFTREIKWGKYQECYNLMEEPLCYRSIFAFPAPPLPCSACYDVLTFSVRYTFTDCNCLTCDTVISYSIKRQCKEEIAKSGAVVPDQLSAGMLSLQKLHINRMKPVKTDMGLNNRK
jgi:uncharacterized repeat protein (TIGR01451 family)